MIRDSNIAAQQGSDSIFTKKKEKKAKKLLLPSHITILMILKNLNSFSNNTTERRHKNGKSDIEMPLNARYDYNKCCRKLRVHVGSLLLSPDSISLMPPHIHINFTFMKLVVFMHYSDEKTKHRESYLRSEPA